MRTYPTRQAVFDAVWDNFVVKKNPKSSGPNRPSCLYSGTGCAIGCLIDDKDLCKKMDKPDTTDGSGTAIRTYIVDPNFTAQLCLYFPFLLNASNTLISKEVDFLAAIQDAHDDSGCVVANEFHQGVEFALEEIATEYQLTVPKKE